MLFDDFRYIITNPDKVDDPVRLQSHKLTNKN